MAALGSTLFEMEEGESPMVRAAVRPYPHACNGGKGPGSNPGGGSIAFNACHWRHIQIQEGACSRKGLENQKLQSCLCWVLDNTCNPCQWEGNWEASLLFYSLEFEPAFDLFD